MIASKRPRSSSPSTSLSSSRAASPTTSKVLKTVQDTPQAQLTCNLPPTCAHKPTQLASTRELETHYATYHSHVCESRGCGCVFPDARLLDLHFAECHDPITALKKERGEKTFACHLASCRRLFLTPKARRLHLIHAHGYPKEYFFSVTNKGIGGLLNRWGQGASLIRGEWKPRMRDQEMESASDSDAEAAQSPVASRKADSPLDDGEVYSANQDDQASSLTVEHSDSPPQFDPLAEAMSSLTLVPNKIRFGRGGKKGGFVHPHAEHGRSTSEKVKLEENGRRPVRRGGGKRNPQRKASEGTSSTSGDPDAVAMQE